MPVHTLARAHAGTSTGFHNARAHCGATIVLTISPLSLRRKLMCSCVQISTSVMLLASPSTRSCGVSLRAHLRGRMLVPNTEPPTQHHQPPSCCKACLHRTSAHLLLASAAGKFNINRLAPPLSPPRFLASDRAMATCIRPGGAISLPAINIIIYI